MADEIAQTWERNEPDSPCVKICLIHADEKICMGCFRTAAEISDWPAMEAGARLALKSQLPDRAARLKAKRRGGAGRRRMNGDL